MGKIFFDAEADFDEDEESTDMKEPTLIIYTRYSKHISKLSIEQKGLLLTAVIAYTNGEALPDLDPVTDMLFGIIADDIDYEEQLATEEARLAEAQEQARQAKAEIGRISAQKRWKKKNGSSDAPITTHKVPIDTHTTPINDPSETSKKEKPEIAETLINTSDDDDSTASENSKSGEEGKSFPPTTPLYIYNKYIYTDNKSIKESEKNKELLRGYGGEEGKKEKKPVRHKYGEFKHVLLTDEQYAGLLKGHTEEELQGAIKAVDEYCEQSGKTYKNYALTIRKWGFESAQRQYSRQGQARAEPQESAMDRVLKSYLEGDAE